MYRKGESGRAQSSEGMRIGCDMTANQTACLCHPHRQHRVALKSDFTLRL